MRAETEEFGMIRCTVTPAAELVIVETIEGKRPFDLRFVRARLWGCEELDEALDSARAFDRAARSQFSGDQLRALTWAADVMARNVEARHIASAAAALGDI